MNLGISNTGDYFYSDLFLTQLDNWQAISRADHRHYGKVAP